jgi:hypothetical protein
MAKKRLEDNQESSESVVNESKKDFSGTLNKKYVSDFIAASKNQDISFGKGLDLDLNREYSLDTLFSSINETDEHRKNFIKTELKLMGEPGLSADRATYMRFRKAYTKLHSNV